MKKLFLLVFLFCMNSCAGQEPVFENVEALPEKVVILPMTVDWIKDDTARIVTENFKVKYEVDSRDLEPGKQYLFKLLIVHCDGCRVRNASIIWKAVTPIQAAINIREKINKT